LGEYLARYDAQHVTVQISFPQLGQNVSTCITLALPGGRVTLRTECGGDGWRCEATISQPEAAEKTLLADPTEIFEAARRWPRKQRRRRPRRE
jgi:hypothetical protein